MINRRQVVHLVSHSAFLAGRGAGLLRSAECVTRAPVALAPRLAEQVEVQMAAILPVVELVDLISGRLWGAVRREPIPSQVAKRLAGRG